jgi:hypothetical protein
MIGNNDAVGSERHQTLGVRRMQHAFHDEGPLPALAQPAKLIPGMTAAAAHLHDHLSRGIPGCAPGGIRHNVLRAKHSGFVKGQGPKGRGRHLENDTRTDDERNRHAAADVARPLRFAGAVDGRHQHLCARGVGAPQKIEGNGVIVGSESVELEPEHVRRNLGDALDRRIRGSGENERNVAPLRLARKIFLGSGPH